jgi:hypothetical protein
VPVGLLSGASSLFATGELRVRNGLGARRASFAPAMDSVSVGLLVVLSLSATGDRCARVVENLTHMPARPSRGGCKPAVALLVGLLSAESSLFATGELRVRGGLGARWPLGRAVALRDGRSVRSRCGKSNPCRPARRGAGAKRRLL